MKKTKRSLSLNKETVRALTPTALAGIVGGGSGLPRSQTSCGPCSTYEDSYCDPGHSLNECQTVQCIVSHVTIC